MPNCSKCSKHAHYRDRQTGAFFCPEHARLEVVGMRDECPGVDSVTLRNATPSDRDNIANLAYLFWEETLVDCFDRTYDVSKLPALVAADGRLIVGALVYSLEREALIIVLLNIEPEYQGRGVARQMLDAACQLARRAGCARVAVSTSNDDLPALALYQSSGFRLTELVAGREIEHHGYAEAGFGGIPVRDEIRLLRDLDG
jgi:GNAT superfamily N-acetyltransferase